MKTQIVAMLVVGTLAFSARAQVVVYDPINNVQQILSAAEDLAKYVEMINNQVQQIKTLTDQLNEFKHYEDLFGERASCLHYMALSKVAATGGVDHAGQELPTRQSRATLCELGRGTEFALGSRSKKGSGKIP